MQQSAFGGDARARVGVVKRGNKLRGCGVVRARFDSERSLADGGEHNVRVHHLRDAGGSAEAIHSGDGQNDGVEFSRIEFFQARVHVAAQIEHFEIGTIVTELRLAAQAAGADARARMEGLSGCARCGKSSSRAGPRDG